MDPSLDLTYPSTLNMEVIFSSETYVYYGNPRRGISDDSCNRAVYREPIARSRREDEMSGT
jgi:hypothetical protein